MGEIVAYIIAGITTIIVAFFTQLRKMRHFKCVSACITCEENNYTNNDNDNNNDIELDSDSGG